MKNLFLGLSAGFIVLSVVSLALADAIVIRPGSRITIYDAPVEVACEGNSVEPFVRYCKCAQAGFSETFELDITLDRNGASDVLGSYDNEPACLASLKANPACAGK